MKLAVLKYGGSTFRELHDYMRIAEYLVDRVHNQHERVVVVTSGCYGLTERLRETAAAIHPELGEQMTAGLLPLADSIGAQLLCHAAQAVGLSAIALMSAEIGIITDDNHLRARPMVLRVGNIRRALKDHMVVTIPGGQAATRRARQSWLGKNSSDYSAVLISSMLRVPSCEIFSDTPGVYSDDPNLIRDVQLIPELSYHQACQLSMSGAKVLHYEAVRCAEAHGIEIICRYNRGSYDIGTRIGRGHGAVIVCPDMRSRTFAFATDQDCLRARQLLLDHNLPVISLAGRYAKTLVVSCGHSHPEKYLADAAFEYTEIEGAVLMTACFGDGSVTHELVSKDRAVADAQVLHDRYYSGNTHHANATAQCG